MTPLPLPACALRSSFHGIVPAHDADGEFWSFETWVCKAVSWIDNTNPLCIDAFGRRLRNGGDFMRARDEGAFPVRFWYGECGQSKSGQRRAKAAHRAAMKLHYPWRYRQIQERRGDARDTPR